MSKIAFLGLGAMGSRMASNLVKAGHDVTVWNRDPSKAAALHEQGARIAVSAKAASETAEFVFSMVTDDQAARQTWLDPNTGAVAGLRPGTIAIECSTVTPAWVRELSLAVLGRKAQLLDAPVAGSRPQAEAAQLVFMAGGTAQAFDRAQPVLAALAANVMHVGGAGQGAVLKLAINTLFAAQLGSVAELLGFLSRNGFDAPRAADLIGQFPIVATPIAGAAKMMAAKNMTPLFTIDLIEKDLGYILDTAKASGSDLPGAACAHVVFRRAQDLGLGSSNVTGLAQVFAV